MSMVYCSDINEGTLNDTKIGNIICAVLDQLLKAAEDWACVNKKRGPTMQQENRKKTGPTMQLKAQNFIIAACLDAEHKVITLKMTKRMTQKALKLISR
jgi:hypothetical protein